MAECGESMRLLTDISLHENTLGECRVIIVGKTGTGKSTLGNKLLGKRPFSGSAAASGTSQLTEGSQAHPNSSAGGFEVADLQLVSTSKACQYAESKAWGKNLKVVDTPGFFDTNENEKSMLIELTRCMSLSAPGPHAIILVIRLDVPFTKEEDDAVHKVFKMFDEKVKDYLIVAFTHGEKLCDRHTDLMGEVSKLPNLASVLARVQNRYVVLSAITDRQEAEMRTLLEKIDHLSSQGAAPHYFTDKTLSKQAEEIERKVEKLRQNDPNLTFEDALSAVRRKIADSNEHKKLLQNLALITGGSVAFSVLAGVTGGIALGATPLVAAGIAEGAAAGAAIGGAGGGAFGVSAAFARLVAYLRERGQRDTQGANRICVIS